MQRGVHENDDMASIRPPGSVPAPLTGTYTRHGSTLTGPVQLLLVRRSNTTTAKSSLYVLRVHENGRRSYVSSLWDTASPGTYGAEYRGVRYTVTVTEDKATFTTTSGETPMYINGVSGNSIAGA